MCKKLYASSRFIIFLVFILISNLSFAIGFGKVTLYSHLNEPLKVDVELLGGTEYKKDNLNANLASSKEFAKNKIERLPFLDKLAFEVINHKKKSVVYITSSVPVKQPFLEFLIELTCPEGRLIKSFTILLDPPLLYKEQLTKPLKESLDKSIKKIAIPPKKINHTDKNIMDFNVTEIKEVVENLDNNDIFAPLKEEDNKVDLSLQEIIDNIDIDMQQDGTENNLGKEQDNKLEINEENTIIKKQQPINVISRLVSKPGNYLLDLIMVFLLVMLIVYIILSKYSKKNKQYSIEDELVSNKSSGAVETQEKIIIPVNKDKNSDARATIDDSKIVKIISNDNKKDYVESNNYSVEEIVTKFNLAKQYMEFGDNDNAGQILTEVITNVSGDDKVKAQSMLDEIKNIKI